MNKIFTLLFCYLLLANFLFAQTKAEKQTVKVSATYQTSSPKIKFSWQVDAGANYYIISKKTPESTSWGPAYANIPDTSTYFEDSDVEIGKLYEYKFYKNNGIGNPPGYSYMSVGIEIPAIEYRGTVIMLIDSNYYQDLNMEIDRMKLDLVGDGWKVVSHLVARDKTVNDVKAIIVNDKANYPEVSTLYILGHVAVPYSGNLNPDAHPDHLGAWPADLYYGELDGTWTDASVNNTVASRNQNDNVAGDGKFDQSQIPSDVDLEVGRVDLFNLPSFASSDTFLIKQYLDKDHDFRHQILTADYRALVDDNFQSFDEAFSQTGWRYFSNMFGADQVTSLDFFNTLKTDSYLWSFGCGGGSYTSCGGIGNTDNFASSTVKSVFTVLFGSYFGDWDSENNFLRAPLASSNSALVSFWSGRPHWHLQHMVMGQHVGYSARISQNNSALYTTYQSYTARGVHIALMGDPTLRMHIVEPATDLSVDSIGNVTVQLSWTASSDPDIIGYEIFRAKNLWGTFEKINDSPITGTAYIDNKSLNGKNIYMLRALKLQKSGSGSYYNLSQGIFDSTSTFWPASLDNQVSHVIVTTYPNPSHGNITLYIGNPILSDYEITIYNSIGKVVYRQPVSGHAEEIYISLNLSYLSKGIYNLKVACNNSYSYKQLIIE